MVHLASGYSAYGSLSVAFPSSEKKRVYHSPEYFTIGPLFKLDTDKGKEERVSYFRNLFQAIHASEFSAELEAHVGIPFLKELAISGESVCLWYSDDSHEQILLRAACATLKQEQIFLINVSELVEDAHRVKAVAQCTVAQLKNVFPKKSVISKAMYLQYVNEWHVLMQSKKTLHLFSDGKIVAKEDDYFDASLLLECTDTFTSASKVIGKAMGKIPVTIGDHFLNYRLRVLIEKGLLLSEGDDTSLLQMSVKKL